MIFVFISEVLFVLLVLLLGSVLSLNTLEDHYVYMVCWYISGCCSFEGCQILGHCEAIFTIQQCFPCSNVTLRRVRYQRRDSIHESGNMF